MPAADMMTLGVMSKFMFLDSSLVMESFSPGKSMGLIPRSTRLCLLVIALQHIVLKHMGGFHGQRAVHIDLEAVMAGHKLSSLYGVSDTITPGYVPLQRPV